MEHLQAGAVTGIGSVPHDDPRTAAEFSLAMCRDLPFVPQLAGPDRSGLMIAQGLLGVRGVDVGRDGELFVDPARLDPSASVTPALDHPAHAPLRAFLDRARDHRPRALKWQFTGPLTLGMALMHVGVPARTAFGVAARAVQVTTGAVFDAIDDALPGVHQVVLLDEPSAATVLCPGFPVPPDAAIDLVSGALAGLEGAATVGLHCCAGADMMALVLAGPRVLSFPLSSDVVACAGQLSRFLENGGWVAWGVVPTDRPLASVDRYWRALTAVWRDLEANGCNADDLRRRSLFTPACGLATHTPEQAALVFDLCNRLADRVGTTRDVMAGERGA